MSTSTTTTNKKQPSPETLLLTTSMSNELPVIIPDSILSKRARYVDVDLAATAIVKEGKVDAFKSSIVEKSKHLLAMHKRERVETENILERLESSAKSEQANVDRLRKRVIEARKIRKQRNQCETQAKQVLTLPSTQVLRRDIEQAQLELTKTMEALEATTLLSQAQEASLLLFVQRTRDNVMKMENLFTDGSTTITTTTTTKSSS
jgi:hypothetical protein